ncbi:MAG: hypothetical protein GY719_26175 [bacterium]|nr:hypothetical protein [bacterium]
MPERKEPAAKGSTATLAARVLWLVENADDLEFEIAPGPAAQWYFADWLADRAVRRMSSTARGVHMDSLSYAWGDRVPCSLPADDDELLMGAKGIPAGQEAAVAAEAATAWEQVGGRLWQRGLLKTYLSQLWKRLEKTAGGYKTRKNEKGLSDIAKARQVLTSNPPYGEPEDSSRTAPAELPPSAPTPTSPSAPTPQNPPAPREGVPLIFKCSDGEREITRDERVELGLIMAELEIPEELLDPWLADFAETLRHPGGCSAISVKLGKCLARKLRQKPPVAGCRCDPAFGTHKLCAVHGERAPDNGKPKRQRFNPKTVDLPRPLDVDGFRDRLVAYHAFRGKTIRRQWKPQTWEKRLAEMAEWGPGDAAEAMQKGMKNEWQGLFRPKAAGGGQGAHGGALGRLPDEPGVNF